MSLSRRSGWKIAIILVMCLITVGIIVGPRIYDRLVNPFDDEKFDQKLWLANAETEDHNPRGLMLEDLRKNYLHKGMARKEVRRLLGVPILSPGEDTEPKPVEQDPLDYYFLGNWGFMGQGTGLVVYYDKHAQVESTELDLIH